MQRLQTLDPDISQNNGYFFKEISSTKTSPAYASHRQIFVIASATDDNPTFLSGLSVVVSAVRTLRKRDAAHGVLRRV